MFRNSRANIDLPSPVNEYRNVQATDIWIPFSPNYTIAYPDHVPIYSLSRQYETAGYKLAMSTADTSKYADAADAFLHYVYRRRYGPHPTAMCFRNQWYFIGPGFVYAIMGQFKDSPRRWARVNNTDLVLKPLIVTFVQETEAEYVRACMSTMGREPEKNAYVVVMDENIDVKNTQWPGLRTLYRKFLQDKMEGCTVKLVSSLDSLYPKPRIPNFMEEEYRTNALKQVTRFALRRER